MTQIPFDIKIIKLIDKPSTYSIIHNDERYGFLNKFTGEFSTTLVCNATTQELAENKACRLLSIKYACVVDPVRIPDNETLEQRDERYNTKVRIMLIHKRKGPKSLLNRKRNKKYKLP